MTEKEGKPVSGCHLLDCRSLLTEKLHEIICVHKMCTDENIFNA